jgi:hypothetical protein
VKITKSWNLFFVNFGLFINYFKNLFQNECMHIIQFLHNLFLCFDIILPLKYNIVAEIILQIHVVSNKSFWFGIRSQLNVTT